jgi:hypothetical protein
MLLKLMLPRHNKAAPQRELQMRPPVEHPARPRMKTRRLIAVEASEELGHPTQLRCIYVT